MDTTVPIANVQKRYPSNKTLKPHIEPLDHSIIWLYFVHKGGTFLLHLGHLVRAAAKAGMQHCIFLPADGRHHDYYKVDCSGERLTCVGKSSGF
jgi:hypothetical protein